MSYLVIKYKKDVKEFVGRHCVEIEKELVDVTSKLFNKKPEEIIVDFEMFETYGGTRDILIRGETSDKNNQLLLTWAEEIKKVLERQSSNGIEIRIGIKTYLVVSAWQEIELK